MYKFLILILFFVNTLFSSVLEDDLKVLNDLGLESSFLSEKSLLDTFDEYSSSYNISYYNNMLRKSSLNAQIVKTEIKNENLPDAVFFIPLLESSFVNQSKSKNSPAGLWQIIPQTAKSLRLRVDESIDERLDLIKSTDAAGSYLKKYHVRLKKWYLTLIAYTCGEGRVIEGITRATIDEYLEQNPQMVDDISIRSYKNSLDNYKKTKQGLSDLYDIFESLQRKGYKFSFSYLIANNDKRTIKYAERSLRIHISDAAKERAHRDIAFLKERASSSLDDFDTPQPMQKVERIHKVKREYDNDSPSPF